MLRTKLKEELFKFKKHPKITKEINEVLKQYYNSLLYTIESGTAKEWDFANEKMNAVQTLQLQRIASKVPREVLVSELAKISKSPHNYEALKSFQQRKIGDFTISERVWKITEQMRDELEFAIDVSLADGKSANQLAREIKKYLNEPDRLYRRVRDKHGNLVLSQNAKNFHPGQGVYRSSHKNALRLAKEEINTAYRESEQLRIMQNNDVVGIEIKLSPSHKIYDICDELKGRYPKDFKWSKWHIGCMCHRITILKSDEEFIKELQNGENLPPESSKNFVSDVPKNFTQWVEDNEDRFKNWKRKPNFLEENKKWVGKTKREREKNVLLLDREKQFDTLYEYPNGGKVLQHKLAKRGEDYPDILKASQLFAERGKVVEIMPEIDRKERTIRNIVFPNLSSKTSNPDIRIVNKYYDVKRPSAIKNIESNANKASKQGAIAIISDSRLDKELTERIMKIRANYILKNKAYSKKELVYLKDNQLYFY